MARRAGDALNEAHGPAPQHILVFPTWYPSEHDPVLGSFVEQQARILSRRYRVTVVAPDVRTLPVVLRRGLGTRLAVESRHGIDVVRPRAMLLVPRRPWRRAVAYRRALEVGYTEVLHRGGRPALIHAHVAEPAGWAATEFGREQGIPVALTEPSGPYDRVAPTQASRAIVAQALERATRLVAVAPAVAADMRRIVPAADVVVIGNVIDTDRFAPPEDVHADVPRTSEPFTFVSVGLLTPVKGMDVLIRAAATLLRIGVGPFRVEIVGDGGERRRLERLTRDLGLEALVRFTGRLGPDAVARELRRSDAFVLASRSETFGIALAEALACGLPAIATRTDGAAFVAEGLEVPLVPIGDVDALAGAMAALMSPERRWDGRAARRSIVERFGADAFLAAIDLLYRSVSDQRPLPELPPTAGSMPSVPEPATRPSVTIVLPAYNEAARIGPALDELFGYLRRRGPAREGGRSADELGPWDVLVVDDGSSDNTADIVAGRPEARPGPDGEAPRLRVLRRPHAGKGGAVQAGMLDATADLVVFSDADLATPPDQLPMVTELLLDHDLVLGSRVQPDGTDRRSSQPRYRRMLGRAFHGLAAAWVTGDVPDTQCGFKGFRRAAAQDLFARQRVRSIVFDAELIFMARKRQYRMAIVPVQWSDKRGSRMQMRPRLAMQVIWDLFRIPLIHRRIAVAPEAARADQGTK